MSSVIRSRSGLATWLDPFPFDLAGPRLFEGVSVPLFPTRVSWEFPGDDPGLLMSLPVAEFGPDEIEVEARGRMVTVRAAREERDGWRRPFGAGRSYRKVLYESTIRLPDGVAPEELEATLRGGRLLLRAGRPAARARRIPIRVTRGPRLRRRLARWAARARDALARPFRRR